MIQFLNGMLMMAFCVAGLFFFRYWRTSHDRLFLMFSISFCIMGVNRLLLDYFTPPGTPPYEHRVILYLIRLVAFLLILVAIIDKNRTSRIVADPMEQQRQS